MPSMAAPEPGQDHGLPSGFPVCRDPATEPSPAASPRAHEHEVGIGTKVGTEDSSTVWGGGPLATF